MARVILSLILISLLTACGSKRFIAPPVSISNSDAHVAKKLYAHYNEWRGVKYREGGMSKKGVDCSGFVHLVYKKKLNKAVPRSTNLLSSSGEPINIKNIRPGDTLFFKTGWKARHVGIYLGKGEFMHASSSRGVMISKLNNPYWINAYWMARRY